MYKPVKVTLFQKVFRFDNDLGASVVRHPYSMGYYEDLWELAVVRWSDGEWHVTYDTPITRSTIGYLDEDQVLELLQKIEALEE